MWKISRVDTMTHSYTMKHTDGRSLDLKIPVEHLCSNDAKANYLKQQTDFEDSKLQPAEASIPEIVMEHMDDPAKDIIFKLKFILLVESIIIIGIILKVLCRMVI